MPATTSKLIDFTETKVYVCRACGKRSTDKVELCEPVEVKQP